MKIYTITLTKEEREYLLDIVQKGKHNAKKIRNANVLLNCDEGEFSKKVTNELVSKVLNIGTRTIDRIKKDFVEYGIEIVLDGKPRQRKYIHKIDGDTEAKLVALACSEAPTGHSRWTLRLLSEHMIELKYLDNISHETIRQTLKKTNLNLGEKKDL